MIPEELHKQLKYYADKRWPLVNNHLQPMHNIQRGTYLLGAEYGYSLSQSKIEALNKRVVEMEIGLKEIATFSVYNYNDSKMKTIAENLLTQSPKE